MAVRTLVQGNQAAGYYQVRWDSKSNQGQLVPSAVYYYHINTKGFKDVQKIFLNENK